ncbi:XRE family transcriptional regulator [Pseudochelatococcus contaminans]|uniref:Phage repressor protein C with HTH and peptisase S24 domain n=1 Tax=Pseudochelatococcus contaminans TaxID=1538103 RepID=A0A7W6EDZ3_9HYPH|nr:LexA family transcriptional regulator [Pseudochelatococcus contaminans]MBB3807948.1 phage repressor protein C with HTH and peptisase S24 domain [Pseudochelatococcus contaminans]
MAGKSDHLSDTNPPWEDTANGGNDHDIGRRIRFLFERLGGQKAAAATDKSIRSLQRYFSGAEPPASVVKALAKATGVSADWILFGGDEPTLQPSGSSSNQFVYIPKFDAAEAQKGIGNDAIHSSAIAMRESWLKGIGTDPRQAYLLSFGGDSMEPTIRDGDLLLVDRSVEQVIDHGIYVLLVGGRLLVKRVQLRHDGSLVLRNDNPAYEVETVSADEASRLVIEGRVRWFGRTV